MLKKSMSDAVVSHSVRLVASYHAITGRALLEQAQGTPELEWTPEVAMDIAAALYAAPFVVVSHGAQLDPVLNYGNRVALDLWGMAWEEFTQTPSRFTAEEPQREERARLLQAVNAIGFIDDYSGVRISKTGRRFLIESATVWNVLSGVGERIGQAATFTDWKWID